MNRLYHYTLESRRIDTRSPSKQRTVWRYRLWAPDGREIVVSRWRTSRQYAQDRAERTIRIFNAPASP